MISMDKDSERIGSAAQDSLSQFAKLLKEFATKVEVREDTASYWQLVFLQSKANAVLIVPRIYRIRSGTGPKVLGFRNSGVIASMLVNLPDNEN